MPTLPIVLGALTILTMAIHESLTNSFYLIENPISQGNDQLTRQFRPIKNLPRLKKVILLKYLGNSPNYLPAIFPVQEFLPPVMEMNHPMTFDLAAWISHLIHKFKSTPASRIKVADWTLILSKQVGLPLFQQNAWDQLAMRDQYWSYVMMDRYTVILL